MELSAARRRFTERPGLARPLLASLLSLACALAACSGDQGDLPPITTYDATGPVLVLPAPKKDASDGQKDAAPRDAGRDRAGDASLRDAGEVEGGGDGGVDTGMTVPYPAFDPTAPQVVDNGGLVLANANFVPVVFAGETLTAPIASFMSAIGSSQYWATIGMEYGVGPATSSPLIVDTYAPGAQTTDADIQTWLAQAIATDPRFLALGVSPDAGTQAPDPNAVPPPGTVYVLFYPDGTAISDASGSSCTAFGGYHYTLTLGNGATVVYAVIPRCTDFAGLSGIDDVTAVTSHELIESATDPETYTSPGYVGTDVDHFIWELVVGNGEVGDMCSFLPDAWIYPAEPALSSYLVQRIWSNENAAAGLDPCVPATNEVTYFNAVPEATLVSFVDQGMSYQTLGNQIAVGQAGTLTLDLFSHASTDGAWTVTLLDYGKAFGNPTVLEISPLGATTGVNGQKVQFQITPLSAGTATLFGMSPYFIYSTQGSVSSFAVGVITN
jgi:hypothetical protein